MAKNKPVIHTWAEIRPAKTGNGTIYVAVCGIKMRLKEGEIVKEEFGLSNCGRCKKTVDPPKYREGF